MIFFFRSEKNLVKLQEEKERENICYTCDVFQHVKNQLELMTWNWIIPIIPIGLCQNIAFFLIVCKKKSWKFSNGFSYASCSPGVLTRFFDQLQKDTLIIKLKSKQILEKTRHKFFSSFGLWTFFKNKSTR